MMRKNTDSSLRKTILWGVEHDAFDRPLGQCLFRNWELGVCDEESAGLINDLVRPLQTRDEFGELPPFRMPHLPRGDFEIGQDRDGNPIAINTQLLNAGLLELGNTGASKSDMMKRLILGLAPIVDGLWCSDMYKKEIRHLRPFLRHLGKDFIIACPYKVKVNMLQPDGNDVSAHLSLAVDILTRALGLPPRSVTILRRILHRLYKKFGNYAGKTNAWPTLYDVYVQILTLKGLNASAREALLDRLGAFLIALTPAVGAYRLAWRPSDLSRHFIDFEFRSASEQVKTVILNYFLFSVLHRRVAQGKPNAVMDFWAAFEDAQRFFSARGETTGDITPAEELAGLIRGTGTGIAFTAQSLSGLPKGLLANLATKVMFRLGSHSDYETLGADMGMNRQQIEWAKLHLRPGISIWSLAEGPQRRPFIVHTPKLDIPPVVDDDEAERSMEALERLPAVPATEFAHWDPDAPIELDTAGSPAPIGLPTAELRFLRAVVEQPGQPSSTYVKLLGMSGRRAAEIRSRLVQEGYLRQHEVATGQRGRNALVMEALEPAFAAIRECVHGDEP